MLLENNDKCIGLIVGIFVQDPTTGSNRFHGSWLKFLAALLNTNPAHAYTLPAPAKNHPRLSQMELAATSMDQVSNT